MIPAHPRESAPVLSIRLLGSFEQRGTSHGEIKDLGSDFGIYVLAFRDPDNIRLELTAPYG